MHPQLVHRAVNNGRRDFGAPIPDGQHDPDTDEPDGENEHVGSRCQKSAEKSVALRQKRRTAGKNACGPKDVTILPMWRFVTGL
jgi:hypothetical protein